MTKVKFFDVLGFKGQEVRFVILIDIYMDIDKNRLKNLFYTYQQEQKQRICY